MSAKGSQLFIIAALLSLWLAGCGTTLKNALQNGGGQAAPNFVNGCDTNAMPYGAGDGSPGTPYLLCSATHLRSLSEDLGTAHSYRLAADIVIPAGTNVGSTEDFRGDLDGAGHYISGLSGLPLIQNNFGRIHHLEMRDLALLASYRVGGIAGMNGGGGIIEDCTANGKIRASYTVGGIVGFNDGDVRRSSAVVNIRGTNRIAGVVGVNRGIVDRAFSYSAIEGSETIVAGLVAEQLGGTITDSYSHGTVRARAKAAGLLAVNEGSVARSYADSVVTLSGIDTAKTGGLIGSGSGSVADSYWDTQTSGQATSNGGTGVTSSQMTSASTFAGWDLTQVWALPVGGTPTLR